MSSVRIEKYTTTLSSSDQSELHAIWESTIGKVHPAYSIPRGKFDQLLTADNATVYVAHRGLSSTQASDPSADPCTAPSSSGSHGVRSGEEPIGFALTYLIKSTSSANPDTTQKGSLAALVVSPEHHGQGVGSKLHSIAVSDLETAVRASLPAGKEGSLQLGSTFPRIFPGLPDIEALQPAKEWFQRRGWTIAAPDAIDLYSPLPNEVDLDQFIDEAREHGTTFRHARPDDRDELMRMEFAEFDSFTGWPDMFPKMMDAGKYNDIIIAENGGKILGATFAALAPCPLLDALTWPSTLGQECGSVACVGIAKDGRGLGAGVGMVAYGFKDLAERGADGVFIDWVGMKGFYERFGAKQWEAKYCDGSRKVAARP